MNPKKSVIIFLLAFALTPFAPSIRALSQKIDRELDLALRPGFPLAAASQSIETAIRPLVAEAAQAQSSDLPGRLIIPSIKLNIAVGSVGLTPTKNMGVLNDPTKVSWYKYGAVPGAEGSAVIGAHVFQAFAKLKDVKLGSSIYVDRKDGARLHFVVSEIEVYPYDARKPLPKIFSRADKARLNLITCYGKLTANGSTYDHRLVVFAELVG